MAPKAARKTANQITSENTPPESSGSEGSSAGNVNAEIAGTEDSSPGNSRAGSSDFDSISIPLYIWEAPDQDYVIAWDDEGCWVLATTTVKDKHISHNGKHYRIDCVKQRKEGHKDVYTFGFDDPKSEGYTISPQTQWADVRHLFPRCTGKASHKLPHIFFVSTRADKPTLVGACLFCGLNRSSYDACNPRQKKQPAKLTTGQSMEQDAEARTERKMLEGSDAEAKGRSREHEFILNWADCAGPSEAIEGKVWKWWANRVVHRAQIYNQRPIQDREDPLTEEDLAMFQNI